MKESTPRRFSFIEPMQALPVAKLPDGDWLYEVKLDGYRALAFKDSKDVRLISRNKKAFDSCGPLGKQFGLEGLVAKKTATAIELLSGGTSLVLAPSYSYLTDGYRLRAQREVRR